MIYRAMWTQAGGGEELCIPLLGKVLTYDGVITGKRVRKLTSEHETTCDAKKRRLSKIYPYITKNVQHK